MHVSYNEWILVFKLKIKKTLTNPFFFSFSDCHSITESIMEQTILRFPHLSDQIFGLLNNESLTKCMEVNSQWQLYLTQQKFFYVRLIQDHIGLSHELGKSWKIAFKVWKTEDIIKLCRVVRQLFKISSNVAKDYGILYALDDYSPFQVIAMLVQLQTYKYLLDKVGYRTKVILDNSPLHSAAKYGMLDVCKSIMEETSDKKTSRRKDGITALHYAASRGHLNLVKYLMNFIDENCLQDRYGSIPLKFATTYDYLDIFQYLIENDNVIDKNPKHQLGYTVLHLAALFGQFAILTRFLENAFDKDLRCKSGKTPLHFAAINGNLAIFKCILQYGVDKSPRCNAGKTPLHFAVMNGNLAISKYILEYSVDKSPICNDGKTPIHYAAWKGHLQLYKYMTSITSEKNPRDQYGKTPLHLAAHSGQLIMCIYMMAMNNQWQEKFPVDNNGNSPFHEAARSGHLDVCNFFMEIFDVNDVRNNNGSSPLHLAAWHGNYEVCEYMLKNTKCINPLNYFGETPLDNAHQNKKFSIAALINCRSSLDQ